ncbi:hypothetical protein ASE03_30220 [Kitasatospora sp. Root187]|nr:hypothetical protein ASC99_30435 [Kitasatospora sp. Root107]KRB68215.1 hypothetical protein ASE03_30220 [Kitasatospora sp. Root187]
MSRFSGIEYGGEVPDQVVGESEFRTVFEQPMQTLGGLRAVPVGGSDDPACGFAWGRRPFAGFVQGQAAPEGCEGHLHALVVPQIALAWEFLMKNHRVVFALVPALLQVVEVGVKSGRAPGARRMTSCQVRAWAYFAHRASVQAEFTGYGAVREAGIGQCVHGFEQPPRVSAGGPAHLLGIG